MKRTRICFTDVFFLFFSVFFRLPQNTRQPFSGTAERIFMKLLPNDTGEPENVVCNVVPTPGEWLKISLCWFMLVRYCGDAWFTLWLWRNHQRAPRTAVALWNHEPANGFNLVCSWCPSVGQVLVRVAVVNASDGKAAVSSGTLQDRSADYAVDGYTNTSDLSMCASAFYYDNSVSNPRAWWQVNLGDFYLVKAITVYFPTVRPG